MSRPELAELQIADQARAWQELGFATGPEGAELGAVRIRFGMGVGDEGITGWTVTGIAAREEIDGLPTTALERDAAAPQRAGPLVHPNGAVGLDHVVVTTPDFDRTAAALDQAGMPLRRTRTVGEGEAAFRQGFRRLGPAILELVESRRQPPGTARFWGLVVIVSDIDALAARLGPERLSEAKPAVQPGRRIATLRRAAGLSMAVAFMDPEPPREPDAGA
jgi:hypothetical protein